MDLVILLPENAYVKKDISEINVNLNCAKRIVAIEEFVIIKLESAFVILIYTVTIVNS